MKRAVVIPEHTLIELIEFLLDVLPKDSHVNAPERITAALTALFEGVVIPESVGLEADAVYELTWIAEQIVNRLVAANLLNPTSTRRVVIPPRQTWLLLLEDN